MHMIDNGSSGVAKRVRGSSSSRSLVKGTPRAARLSQGDNAGMDLQLWTQLRTML